MSRKTFSLLKPVLPNLTLKTKYFGNVSTKKAVENLSAKSLA